MFFAFSVQAMVELMWAVKAHQHAETYQRVIVYLWIFLYWCFILLCHTHFSCWLPNSFVYRLFYRVSFSAVCCMQSYMLHVTWQLNG